MEYQHTWMILCKLWARIAPSIVSPVLNCDWTSRFLTSSTFSETLSIFSRINLSSELWCLVSFNITGKISGAKQVLNLNNAYNSFSKEDIRGKVITHTCHAILPTWIERRLISRNVVNKWSSDHSSIWIYWRCCMGLENKI